MIDKESYAAELGHAIENACQRLPDGYEISIVLERDSGVVILYDDEGDECEFPSNHETLADAICDAVEFAIDDEQKIENERDSSDDHQLKNMTRGELNE